MNFRRHIFLAVALVGLAVSAARSETAPPPAATVARLHWMGIKQIGAETNAAAFMRIWKLPESVKLEAQTLDKLSIALLPAFSNSKSEIRNRKSEISTLRPLLDDLVSAESYLEIRASTNYQLAGRPPTLNSQLILALRLPPDRASLWENTLAGALKTITGNFPVAGRRGWSQRVASTSASPLSGLIEFSRAGEWTVVGVAAETNALFAEFLARLQTKQPPFAKSATPYWLDADADLPRLAAAFATLLPAANCQLPTANFFPFQLSTFNFQLSGPPSTLASLLPAANCQLPTANFFPFQPSTLHLTAIGDGENVLTRASLDFPAQLNLSLEPWLIPTNLIHQPLISLAAVRGLSRWLGAQPAWQKTQLAPAPNQFFAWSETEFPAQAYIAFPLPDATNQVARLAERLFQEGNPWLTGYDAGDFEWTTNQAVAWTGLPMIVPFASALPVCGRDFLVGGLSPLRDADTNSSARSQAFGRVQSDPNLVAWHSEITSTRLEHWLFLTQLARVTFHRPQLRNVAAIDWIVAAKDALGRSLTSVTQTGDRQLFLERSSAVGFTALEIHLLADWLESPQFPRGLHTFLAPPEN